MLKTRPSQHEVAELCQHLHRKLIRDKNLLSAASKEVTNDADRDFEHDYMSMLDMLMSSQTTNFETIYENRKPKGKILILLSYNEPLVMCIDPILKALIAGNEVYVRPSTASSRMFHALWDSVFRSMPWISDRLHVIYGTHESAVVLIQNMQAVYFFGSQHVAKSVGSECAKHSVEFWPETEGADFAIFDASSHKSPSDFAALILDQAFSHSGQMCQRPQGVFVHQEYYDQVLEAVVNTLNTTANEIHNPPTPKQRQMRVSYEALVATEAGVDYMPGKSANSPSLVTNVSSESPLVTQAYFLPTFWLVTYSSNDSLVKTISKRPIQFGCNVWTTDELLIKSIATNTKLTRITINSNHINIRENEGWGGSQPTSFGGNMQWSQKFTNGFTLIRNDS